MSSGNLRVLCLGDIVARSGRLCINRQVRKLKADFNADLVIANAENSSGGSGLDPRCGREIFDAGVDVITLGDHTWRRREVRAYLDEQKHRCVRPANYPRESTGTGSCVVETAAGVRVGILNLLGRTFLSYALDCPFQECERILDEDLKDCTIRICDFHGEATSEKLAFARYFDGKISFIFGTHTHVQTADNRVLPGGTGFMSDLGMCGSTEGVIGLDSSTAIERFLTGQPRSYKAAKGNSAISGAIVDIDIESGRATDVNRVFVMDGK